AALDDIHGVAELALDDAIVVGRNLAADVEDVARANDRHVARDGRFGLDQLVAIFAQLFDRSAHFVLPSSISTSLGRDLPRPYSLPRMTASRPNRVRTRSIARSAAARRAMPGSMRSVGSSAPASRRPDRPMPMRRKAVPSISRARSCSPAS